MRCCQCTGPLGDSPSDDFCSESCQRDWTMGAPRHLSIRRAELLGIFTRDERAILSGGAVHHGRPCVDSPTVMV